MSALLAACAATQSMLEGTQTKYLFEETKHCQNALAAFRLATQRPVASTDRDAVLLTMILLALHSFTLPDDPQCLQGLLSNSYLMLLSGATAIWNQVKSSMGDSVFFPVVEDYQRWKLEEYDTENTICTTLHKMCNKFEISTDVNSTLPFIQAEQYIDCLRLMIDNLKPLFQFSNTT